MITLNWFLSRAIRQATQMHGHVRKMFNAQRDILKPQAVAGLNAGLESMRTAIARNPGKDAMDKAMADLEETAVKWLKPYPNAALRENVEVLLVAIAVAMGIRTFFLQPFKIPTGSMQPTLYGITHENLIEDADYKIPGLFTRLGQYWVQGVTYKHIRAKAEGRLEEVGQPQRFLLFNLKRRFRVGSEWYTIWFPPDKVFWRTGLMDQEERMINTGHVFHPGDDIMKVKVFSGDHLFVDRMTYNFWRPVRGEIIVFETRGIEGLNQEQFYIKRMVAKGSERVQIGDDRHLQIDGQRLDAATPHFEHVYSFEGPPEVDKFSGHVNDTVARRYGHQQLARKFPDQDASFTVQPDHYLVMGDNTMNSLDSRTWGDFPRENVIGKSYFVYWPIGSQNGRPSRFGWGNR